MKKLFGLLLILFYSCSNDIDFIDNATPPYFLNGILEVGKTPVIRVGIASKVSDSIVFKFSCEPDIILKSNIESFRLYSKSTDESDCYFSSDSTIKSSAKYDIEVNFPQKTILKSSLIVPDIIHYTFRNIEITKEREVHSSIDNTTSNIYSGEIVIEIENADYSMINWLGCTVLRDTTFFKNSTFFEKNEKLEGGEIISEESLNTFFACHKINSILKNKIENKEMKIKFGFSVKKDRMQADFIFSLFNIDDNYYNFIRQLIKQQNARLDPFTTPIPSYNNIENGVGIFGAFAEYKEKIRVNLPQ